jgi:hypothetical protein
MANMYVALGEIDLLSRMTDLVSALSADSKYAQAAAIYTPIFLLKLFTYSVRKLPHSKTCRTNNI